MVAFLAINLRLRLVMVRTATPFADAVIDADEFFFLIKKFAAPVAFLKRDNHFLLDVSLLRLGSRNRFGDRRRLGGRGFLSEKLVDGDFENLREFLDGRDRGFRGSVFPARQRLRRDEEKIGQIFLGHPFRGSEFFDFFCNGHGATYLSASIVGTSRNYFSNIGEKTLNKVLNYP